MAEKPAGSYRYLKRLDRGREIECSMAVYPLRVEEVLSDWPEKGQRKREWFSLAGAALAVDDGELVTLLMRLAAPSIALPEGCA